jgi:hypothetical protein
LHDSQWEFEIKMKPWSAVKALPGQARKFRKEERSMQIHSNTKAQAKRSELFCSAVPDTHQTLANAVQSWLGPVLLNDKPLPVKSPKPAKPVKKVEPAKLAKKSSQEDIPPAVLAREAPLIAAARAGATSGLIEYIYRELLPGMARNLARGFRELYGACLDGEDIVQAGIEQVLRYQGRALQQENPVGYLLLAAQSGMLNYCQEQRCVIRVPREQQRSGVTVPKVLSLDAPLGEESDLTLLDLIPS